MKMLARLLLLAACSLALFAADATPNAEVLNRWVGGKWVGNGQFVDSDFSQANKASSVTKCEWSPDHIFVICDQDVVFGGTPMRELSIYSFAPKAGKYYFYGVSLGEEKPRNTALDISEDGNRWLYTSSNAIKGKMVEFRTTNQFHGNDNVEWWSEFSADGGKTWTKTGEGKEAREK
jgi:hypothetical protein